MCKAQKYFAKKCQILSYLVQIHKSNFAKKKLFNQHHCSDDAKETKNFTRIRNSSTFLAFKMFSQKVSLPRKQSEVI